MTNYQQSLATPETAVDAQIQQMKPFPPLLPRAVLAANLKKRWRFWFALGNGLFFDKTYRQTVYESELNQRQYLSEFKLIK